MSRNVLSNHRVLYCFSEFPCERRIVNIPYCKDDGQTTGSKLVNNINAVGTLLSSQWQCFD